MIIFGVHWRHTSLYLLSNHVISKFRCKFDLLQQENFALIAKLKKENEILKFESFNCHVELELC